MTSNIRTYAPKTLRYKHNSIYYDNYQQYFAKNSYLMDTNITLSDWLW